MAAEVLLIGVAQVVLEEGVKFLYDQAGKVLDAWRARRKDPTASPPVIVPAPPQVTVGTSQPSTTAPDADTVLALDDLRADAEKIATGELSVDDPAARATIAALREVLEAALGTSITFEGEATRPVRVSDINVVANDVRGRLTGVRLGGGQGGSVTDVHVQVHDVEAGGDVVGVEIGGDFPYDPIDEATPESVAPSGDRQTRGPHTVPPRGTRPAPGEGQPTGDDATRTQRSVEAEFPDIVIADTVEWLLVSITNGRPGINSIPLGVGVETGETIDIVVQPRKGFTVEGEAHGSLEVPAAGESPHLQFKLRAVDPGRGLIRVLAFARGEQLGLITLEPTVQPAATTGVRGYTPSAPTRHSSETLLPASLQVADLSMLIEEQESAGKLEFRIRLTATDPSLGLNFRKFGPFTLEVDPSAFFGRFFQEIEELPIDTPDQRRVAARRLAAKGAALTEALMPVELRQIMWELRDKLTTIVVQSDEPWIPWELCRLLGQEADGRIVEGPFLCEAFAITRWMPNFPITRTLRVSNLALVVPGDSGLPLATAERDYVLSLAAEGRVVTAIDPTFIEVQDAFVAGSYDAWHFTGHGAAMDANPDRSSIILAGDETLSPEDVSGQAANVGLAHPLVFINACQVARGGMALTGIGGWARRFVQVGAGAFIGAYWSVYDEPAFDFAREVYTRLLDGMPIGEAVRQARTSVRTDGDPTWLAYTVFADPLAAVEAVSA